MQIVWFRNISAPSGVSYRRKHLASDVKAMMAGSRPHRRQSNAAAAASAICFAIKEDLAREVNPCHGVERTRHKGAFSPQPRYPLLEGVNEAGAQGAALKVLLLLGQRPGGRSEVGHIVDGWWKCRQPARA
jgi:hypothetical protein